jgi:predicted nuclease of predicted toxin-antitoxin system
MKLLLNENIPPSLAGRLRSIGHECIHCGECGLTRNPDHEIVRFAIKNDFIIITHDLDYVRIISLSGEPKPSVITFRQNKISPNIFFESLSKALPKMEDFLIRGALVSLDDQLVRYRLLPVKRN